MYTDNGDGRSNTFVHGQISIVIPQFDYWSLEYIEGQKWIWICTTAQGRFGFRGSSYQSNEVWLPRNGRVKNVSAVRRHWIFTNGLTPRIIAKRRIIAARIRLHIEKADATPDNNLLYFTSDMICTYTARVRCNNTGGLGRGYGSVATNLDNPLRFAWREAFLAQYPFPTGCETREMIGTACVGYDPDSGSNVGVQLASQTTSRGKQLNLNRIRTARTFSCLAESLQQKTFPSLARSTSIGKRMWLSIDDRSPAILLMQGYP
jgi:hypothetical protein